MLLVCNLTLASAVWGPAPVSTPTPPPTSLSSMVSIAGKSSGGMTMTNISDFTAYDNGDGNGPLVQLHGTTLEFASIISFQSGHTSQICTVDPSFDLTIQSASGRTNIFMANGNNNVAILDDHVSFFRPIFVKTSAANGMAGQTTLVGGTKTITNNRATSTALIFLQVMTEGGTVGRLSYTVSNGTSFTINSSSATDTSTVNWILYDVF